MIDVRGLAVTMCVAARSLVLSQKLTCCEAGQPSAKGPTADAREFGLPPDRACLRAFAVPFRPLVAAMIDLI